MTDTHSTTTTLVVADRQNTPDRVHPLVAQAMAKAGDPETLRQILDMQKDWEAHEARRQFTAAMVALKSKMPTVVAKDKTVSFGNTNYTYASIGNIIDVVTPHLTAHGLSVSWKTKTDGDAVTVVCRLTHCGGHSEEGEPLTAAKDTKGAKNDAQAKMSTATTLQRYSLMHALGIATADQDEIDDRGPDPSQIDTARNLKAAGALQKAGLLAKFCDETKRTAQDWTAADLEKAREWLKPKAPVAKAEPVEPPPADDVPPTLAEVLKFIGKASSVAELKAVAPYAEQLGADDRGAAHDAYKTRLAEVKRAHAEPGSNG